MIKLKFLIVAFCAFSLLFPNITSASITCENMDSKEDKLNKKFASLIYLDYPKKDKRKIYSYLETLNKTDDRLNIALKYLTQLHCDLTPEMFINILRDIRKKGFSSEKIKAILLHSRVYKSEKKKNILYLLKLADEYDISAEKIDDILTYVYEGRICSDDTIKKTFMLVEKLPEDTVYYICRNFAHSTSQTINKVFETIKKYQCEVFL